MYIARLNNPDETRYIIRESVPDPEGNHYICRDLFDLGSEPDAYIIYIGRNAFYLDPDLEEIVSQKKSESDETDLEELFWPFLTPEVRHQEEFFNHHNRKFTPRKLTEADISYIDKQVHLFDKKRLHYLRYGSLSQASLFKAPHKLFLSLLYKSRDEIEQYFLVQENVLEPDEFRQYVYVIFDLQRNFSETAAQVSPEGLDQERLAEIFEQEFCKHFDDQTFSVGLTPCDLTAYLSRYLVMFFDYAFPASSFEEDYAREFRDQHRSFSFPKKGVVLDGQEAQILFGVSKVELEDMSRSQLTVLYRKLAHEHHPDKGGEHDDFVRLTEIYKSILKTKK